MGDLVLLETLLHPVEQVLVHDGGNAARCHDVLISVFTDVTAVPENLEEAVLHERLSGITSTGYTEDQRPDYERFRIPSGTFYNTLFKLSATLGTIAAMPLATKIPIGVAKHTSTRITAAAGTELADPYSYGTYKNPHVDHFIPV